MPDKKKLNWRTDIVEALDRISKSMFKMTADAKTMEKSTRNMAEATEKARKEIVPQAEYLRLLRLDAQMDAMGVHERGEM